MCQQEKYSPCEEHPNENNHGPTAPSETITQKSRQQNRDPAEERKQCALLSGVSHCETYRLREVGRCPEIERLTQNGNPAHQQNTPLRANVSVAAGFAGGSGRPIHPGASFSRTMLIMSNTSNVAAATKNTPRHTIPAPINTDMNSRAAASPNK